MIEIKVQNSSTDTTTNTYSLAGGYNNVTATSKVYFIQEGQDGKYEVYFGDGVIGKKLSDGNIVILEYIVTNRTEGNGASVFTPPASIDGVTDITLTTVERATGGSEPESIESIKLNAPLDYAAQGRAVSTNDFKAIVPKVYPNTRSVQVYGGEDNDVPVYG